MTDFSKRIFQNGQFTAEFFFHKIYSLSGKERYQVSVKDEMNRFIFFTMEQGFNSWKIINAPKVPDWIMQLEDKLKDEILKSSLA